MSSAIVPVYARADVAFDRGEGAWLISTTGERYLDFGAGIFAEQNAVAGFDFHRDALARIEQFAVAYGDDFGLLRLFLGRIRNNEAALALFAFFQPPDEHAIV